MTQIQLHERILEKLQSKFPNQEEKDRYVREQAFYIVADYFKISPLEVKGWDSDTLIDATTHIAVVRKSQK